MCDYCDCRTRPLLAALGRDHELILGLVRRLRDASDDADRATIAVGLVDVLERHSALEEAGLYPELARAGIPTGAMEAEHAGVDGVLRSIASGARVDPVDLLATLRALEEHVHREEYDLFPAAHQVLDDGAWDRIAEQPPEGEPNKFC